MPPILVSEVPPPGPRAPEGLSSRRSLRVDKEPGNNEEGPQQFRGEESF